MRRRAADAKRFTPGPVVAAVFFLLLPASPASANLRAPVVVPDSPSSALAAPDPGLTVDRESLRFACGPASCDVTAQYEVTAAAAIRVHLDFVLPVESPVTAMTNAETDAVTVVPAQPLRPAEARALFRGGQGTSALFRAGFESSLRAGPNTVSIRYTQPLGAEETDYGYGKKKGRMVQRFRYELWPLREWSRSAGFRVQLAVGIDRPAPGWWQRRFGTVRSATCLSSDPAAPVPPGRREQRGEQLWYEAELGPALPDRITCYLGDDDQMPRH
jgi:hypothetical protein